MHIPDGFAQANIIFGGADFPTGAQVTFGIGVGDFSGTVQDAADAVRDLVNSDLSNLWGGDTSHVETMVKFGPVESGPFASAPGGGGGGASGTNVPANTAVLVRKQTALGGRKHNGRLFWPWVSEGNLDGAGVIGPTVVSSYQSAFDDFLSDLATADLPMWLLHTDSITVPNLVTSLAVQSKVATQRRRLRR